MTQPELEHISGTMPVAAVTITVQGIVQGVGFRPYVYSLAHKLQLTGTIANTCNGVFITLQGTGNGLKIFQTTLRKTPPPASRITTISIDDRAIDNRLTNFFILPSQQGTHPNTLISPDLALCADCRQELFDPDNRRFQYPFINCTHCGPRFSIVEAIPYDRPNTSMKDFPLCPECEREYHDPLNRRFHAQPNACPACGPRLSWLADANHAPQEKNCITACVEALAAGRIVAIKGLGGFHLAVDATSAEAVQRLRHRKHRRKKPLAIMVKDLEQAHELSQLSGQEAELLSSARAPIVLLEKKDNTTLDSQLAPDIGLLGLMLPYTPLHHLLLAHPHCPDALVMTSANLSGEPLCIDNDEALTRLRTIADGFLLHNRKIITREDDSVVRIMADKPRVLRRGRGFTPEPLLLDKQTANTLGCGAEMKSSFCVIRNNEAFISQHIGELTSPRCLDFYTESIDHLQSVLRTNFHYAACDQHPDYLSSRYARQLSLPLAQIQHHHAHAGAVMAEHGLDELVLAIIFDGAGHSKDGTVWGGEWFLAERRTCTRLAHILEFQLPGGDAAAREPWRMASSLIFQAMGEKGLQNSRLPPALLTVENNKLRVISQMLTRQLNSPFTSSCGRLFDGVAGLLGLCMMADYEGQAAMQLEYQAELALQSRRESENNLNHLYQPVLRQGKSQGLLALDPRPLIRQILKDIAGGVSIPEIALNFHYWLLEGTILIIRQLREQTGRNTVVLGGGVMQNKILLAGLIEQCENLGFKVLSGELVPVNDGGIALGQAYIAGATSDS